MSDVNWGLVCSLCGKTIVRTDRSERVAVRVRERRVILVTHVRCPEEQVHDHHLHIASSLNSQLPMRVPEGEIR